MSFSDAVLPVSIEPYDDESGMGYCLRVISCNGASLHALRRLVEVEEIRRFTTKNAKSLSRVFQRSPEWLETALPSAEKTKPYRRDYFGQRWFSRNHLRTQNPQVCIRCIHAKGYCRAIWDVSIGTVCLEHRCRLLDFCTQCRKPLRWDRPRIDVGHCGHLLTTPPETQASSNLFELQSFLEQKFYTSVGVGDVPNCNYSSLLNRLSLSGIHSVIVGFGLRQRPLEVMHSTVRIKTYQCDEWAAIVERGLVRLTHFKADPSTQSQLSELVVENLLEQMVLNHESVHDQKAALALIEQIFKKKIRAEFGSPLAHLSQLELF